MMKWGAVSWRWSKQQSEGRVDCVVETPNNIYIFEFKRDGSAEEALKQIEDMGYAREYAADGRKIYQIGCNFSSKTGTIDGWKEGEIGYRKRILPLCKHVYAFYPH